MKKYLTLMLSIALAAMIVTGCGGSTSSSGSANTESETVSEDAAEEEKETDAADQAGEEEAAAADQAGQEEEAEAAAEDQAGQEEEAEAAAEDQAGQEEEAEAAAADQAGQEENPEAEAAAEGETSAEAGAVESEGEAVYVLMNIPYADFYAAENAVDAITSATLEGKARNVNVNGASYHQSEEAASTEGIAGAVYPVRAQASDLAALGATEITDDVEISYTINVKGEDLAVDLVGADALQENPSYSYYVLAEEPASYKELTVEDGVPAFGAATGEATAAEVEGKVSYTGHHADIEIKLDGISAEQNEVSGVIVTVDDGTAYAMHHVVNIWRGELGWNRSDLDLGGHTITGLRYLLKDGSIQDYAAEITILPAYDGELSGSVNDAQDTFTLEGSLDEFENAKMTVTCTVGEGKGVPSDTVFEGDATNESVALDTEMIASLIEAGEADAEVTFSATVESDNYATKAVTMK